MPAYVICRAVKNCVELLAGNSANAGIQAAFGPRSFVFVHQAFVNHGVDIRECFFIKSRGFFSITGFSSHQHCFDRSTHTRPQIDIVLPFFFALTGSFGGLFGVCHEAFLCLLPDLNVRERRILVIKHRDVNRNSHLGGFCGLRAVRSSLSMTARRTRKMARSSLD
jgi:hypothetical protein